MIIHALHRFLNFLNVVFFTTPYLIKPIIYIFKNTFVLAMFLHSKKNYLCGVIQPSFSLFNVYILTYTEYMYAVFVHQQIFHIQMEQSMYNHMVGRVGSIPTPLYFTLIGSNTKEDFKF